jgi:hypothetical protein
VLSGYLITTLMRIEQSRNGGISYRGFYLRRLLRLMPPLFIVVAAAGLLSALSVIDGGFTPGGMSSALFYFGNYHVISNDFRGMPAGIGLVWSLAIEEHYYLFYPPLAALMLRVGRVGLSVTVLSILCAAVLTWRYWLVFHGGSEAYLTMATDTRVDAILVGCLMALLRNPWLDPSSPESSLRLGSRRGMRRSVTGHLAVSGRSLPAHRTLHPAKSGDRALDLSGRGQGGSAAVSLVERPVRRVYRNDLLHDLPFASRDSVGARQTLAAVELDWADVRGSRSDTGGGGTDAPLGRAALRQTAQIAASKNRPAQDCTGFSSRGRAMNAAHVITPHDVSRNRHRRDSGHVGPVLLDLDETAVPEKLHRGFHRLGASACFGAVPAENPGCCRAVALDRRRSDARRGACVSYRYVFPGPEFTENCRRVGERLHQPSV